MRFGSTLRTAMFVSCFLALTVVGMFASISFPSLNPFPQLQDILTSPEQQWYLAWEREINHRDHYVLYYDIGVSIDHARRSDVLFLGNSRALFGLPHDVMAPFFQDVGLRYFNLAFGHGETNVFPMRIIQNFDLRPKIVVVNADRFFTGIPSEFAELVMPTYGSQDSHQASRNDDTFPQRRPLWEEFKANLEVKTRFFVQDRLQAIFPYLIPRGRRLSESPLLYRSSVHGSWSALNWPSRDLPIRNGNKKGDISASEMEFARAFQMEMYRRNAFLVLMLVPANQVSALRARQLADVLNVPLIAPELDGLTTSDGSHLSPDSARRFASAFLEEFENLPCFGTLVGTIPHRYSRTDDASFRPNLTGELYTR